MGNNYKSFYQTVIKRVFDLLFCIIALPFFALLFIVIGISIKIDDGGPVFYKAERIGRNSKKFNMLKFRSMKVNSENILNSDGSTYNSKNDERVTRVGKIIRATSLDEVAQIINVLKGDMSIIGPRASGWDALESYRDDEKDKMLVRPGISGYTQAYFRNSISVREKRLYDAWYSHNVSFLLDIKIFFKTVQTVFKKDNLYTNEEVKAEEKTEQNAQK